MKKDAMEQLDMCCQTLCQTRPVKQYIKNLESEIKYLEKHRAALLVLSGIFLVGIVLMSIF